MTAYVNVVECAIEHGGRFLVIQRPQGKHAGGLLAFPGGKVEAEDNQGEDILKAAAQREVLEEVGMALHDPLRYVLSTSFMDNQGIDVLLTLFHCGLDRTSPTVTPSPREVPAYFWLTPDQIHQDPKAPHWLKEYVRVVVGKNV